MTEEIVGTTIRIEAKGDTTEKVVFIDRCAKVVRGGAVRFRLDRRRDHEDASDMASAKRTRFRRPFAKHPNVPGNRWLLSRFTKTLFPMR